MDWGAKVTLAFFAFASFLCLIKMIKSKHFFKAIFISALSGIGCIFAVNLLSDFTGVNLAVNWFTLSFSALLGPCGSIGLVLLQLLN